MRRESHTWCRLARFMKIQLGFVAVGFHNVGFAVFRVDVSRIGIS
ncbi:hypothetical protein [Microvirga sp. TS319]